MKTIISLLVILLLNLCATAQTIYYVDTNGNDQNNGTILTTPWKTIQKACNTATPNSIVYIKGGTYNENIVVNVSGTAGNPIIFKNYMNDVVIIDGTGTSSNTLLSITNKSYLSFQNMTIQNRTVNDAQGILVETTGSDSSTALTFRNITIKNIKWTSSPTTIPSSNNNAQAFIAYGGDGGITDIVIDSCIISNNILGYSEALTLDGNIDGFTISNCQIHDNTNIGIDIAGNYQVSSDPATDHARNGIISHNTCYKNVSLVATSAGIYVDGGKNVIIERNKCYENGSGIEIGCEENGTTDSITVKNNLIFINESTGLYVGGYTTATTGQVLNCMIRNNTLFQNNSANDGNGELVMSKASNCIFENNIFYTNTQNIFMYVDDISPQTGNVFNYNCWFTPSNDSNNITVNWRSTTYFTFASYKSGTSQENNSLYGNPDFYNSTLAMPDLRIFNMSPCANTGNPATILSSNETSYDGNPRLLDGNIDMGAYEIIFTLGINSAETMNLSCFVYPNPFTTSTTLFFNDLLNGAELKIYDLLGKEMTCVKNIESQQITLNLASLTDGIYLYVLVHENVVLTQGKLIKK